MWSTRQLLDGRMAVVEQFANAFAARTHNVETMIGDRTQFAMIIEPFRDRWISF